MVAGTAVRRVNVLATLVPDANTPLSATPAFKPARQYMTEFLDQFDRIRFQVGAYTPYDSDTLPVRN